MADETKQTAEFISEAEEIVESINKDLFQLEEMAVTGRYNPDVVNAIFRGAHSLKGLAGMFGFTELQQLAHDIEHLLDALRLGKVDLSKPVVDMLFRGVDALGNQVGAKSRNEAPNAFDALREEIIKIAEGGGTKEEESPARRAGVDSKIIDVLTEYEEHRLNDNIKRGNRIHKITVRFQLETFDTGLAEVTEKLKTKGEILTTLPSGEASDATQIVFDLVVGSSEPAGAFEEAVKGYDASIVTLVEPAQKQEAPKAAEAAAVAGGESAAEAVESLRSASQTVRVDISRLDSLMNIVGELVVQRNTFGKIADRLRDLGMPKLAQQLGREVRTLERKIDELQAGVMDVRMVPVSQIFERLARVVRKVARSENKEIELVAQGGETELDKLLIEDLADPLMHLIRNAIDHGIETPEERGRAGKHPTGTITLKAYPEGNHVVIEVSDDGRGMDPRKIRAKALERGIIKDDEEMTDEEILDLIYLPGFSTREQAGELSGRGVGMDVVKNNIAAMSGVIETRSAVGEGSVVKLTLPITLAIIGALVIEVRGRTYVVPVNSVQQCLRVDEAALMTMKGRGVIQLDERTVPLISLAEFFHLNGPESVDLPYRYVIVVGLAEKRVGILVDRLLGQQDIVIKPVGDLLADTPGIAGATELGGQTTVLVLDVGEVISHSTGGGVHGSGVGTLGGSKG